MVNLPGLYDVIGCAAVHDRIVFVPILGDFEFVRPEYYLHRYADLSFLSTMMDSDLYENNSLWVRARLIKLFGINHPSGHGLATYINFQAVAIEVNADQPASPIPFVVSDTFNGIVDDYGEPTDAFITFEQSVDHDVRTFIAEAFWSLLLTRPFGLGIFSDYWTFAGNSTLYRISCDGTRFEQEFLGFLERQDDEECDEDDVGWWWPFDLPGAPVS